MSTATLDGFITIVLSIIGVVMLGFLYVNRNSLGAASIVSIIIVISISISFFYAVPHLNTGIEKRKLNTKDITFNNIEDHDVDDTNLATFSRDLVRNSFYSFFNLFSSEDNEKPLAQSGEYELSAPVCTRPSHDDDHYDVAIRDYSAKDEKSEKNFMEGTSYRDQVSCIHKSQGRADWAHDHSKTGSRCHCKKAFGGCRCELELHDGSYTSIADIDDIDSHKYIHYDNFYVDRISFPERGETSCSLQCDKSSKCKGFIIKQNTEEPEKGNYTCTLLEKSIIHTNGNITNPSPFLTPSIFVKNKDGMGRPKYKDRVIIGGGPKILRPWSKMVISTHGSSVVTLFSEKSATLNFFPTYVINDTGPEEGFEEDYGKKLIVVFSSLPIFAELVEDPGSHFSNSENMKKYDTTGYFNVDIPREWKLVHCFTYFEN